MRDSRRSRHRFPSAEAEAAASIYNAQAIYRERVSTPQLYIFPPYGQQNETVAAAAVAEEEVVAASSMRLRGSSNQALTAAA